MLHQTIRRLREQAGLTQEVLARRAGIHRVTLGEIEAGREEPRLDTLRRLARALNVSVADLLSERKGGGR
jgi:transcriptional regulator with XRE-family HTH domain